MMLASGMLSCNYYHHYSTDHGGIPAAQRNENRGVHGEDNNVDQMK